MRLARPSARGLYVCRSPHGILCSRSGVEKLGVQRYTARFETFHSVNVPGPWTTKEHVNDQEIIQHSLNGGSGCLRIGKGRGIVRTAAY